MYWKSGKGGWAAIIITDKEKKLFQESKIKQQTTRWNCLLQLRH